jgi:O-glycosyl hydrolase
MKFHYILSAQLLVSGFLFAQTATIDFSSLQQEIDGFGASSAGHGALTATQMDAAFSNNTQNQIGLSILRVEIDVGGGSLPGRQRKTTRLVQRPEAPDTFWPHPGHRLLA